MNTERLRELVDKLLTVEGAKSISTHLQQAASSMQDVVNSPNQPEPQTRYANQFGGLRRQVSEMIASFTPAEIELMSEISAGPFFAQDFTDEVAALAQQNAVTPAVVLQKLQELQSKRSAYISTITGLRDRLNEVGIKPPIVEPGTAELGVLLPRSLFGDQLPGLIGELGVINQIFRIFSEVVTGDVEPVRVRQISTTDPLFSFGMAVGVVIAIGRSVTWALATWKTIEEIRKLRSETQKNGSFSEEEIKAFFDSKIEASIEKAIKARASELTPTTTDTGRAHELAIGIDWALRSIMTRVERGMTIEVRFLPPKAKKGGDPVPEDVAQRFAEIAEIVPQLKFPPPADDPILALPPPKPPANENGPPTKTA